MLLQLRPDRLRLITQHHHALAAGRLAGAWRSESHPDGLPWPIALATSLHDLVWLDEDREPRLDRAAGIPHSFETLPEKIRRGMLESGTERLEAADAEVAALVRAHHEALRSDREPSDGARWIRFFDLLSLKLCLTPPDADPEGGPGWLRRAPLDPPTGGGPLRLRWDGPEGATLEPFAFLAPIGIEIPYRDLPRKRWKQQRTLAADWDAAPTRLWSVELRPESG